MKTKWLRLAMAISLSLMVTYVAYASPSAPALPLTLDGTTGAISWGPATVAYDVPSGNIIDYYEWELRLNGAPTPKTTRLNTTVSPPAIATFAGGLWNDDLDNGSFGPVTPLDPGMYQLAVRAYDLDDSPTVQGNWQTLDLNVYPSTPVVTVVEEVWNPDGTYTISWLPNETAIVEEVLVEWTFDGWETTYSSPGWIPNTGSYNTGAIPETLFWDAVTVRVTTRDSQSLLTSTPGTTTYDPVVWAPNWISVNTGAAPNWTIAYGYANPVDVDYFIFKLYATFNGSATDITQGIEDTDKNFSVGFNPVTDSTLPNIYGHDWVMRIGASDVEDGGVQYFAYAGFPLTLANMGTISMTSAADANPWVFHVTYNDPYNNAKWATTPGGYLDFVNLLFDYQAFGWTETERPTPVFGLPGEIDLTVYPATDLTAHSYYNKYRTWRVTASPGLTCNVASEEHLAASSFIDFTTVCPPFDPPQAGYSEYLDGSYYQVPEFPTSIDGKIWQGVSSGTPIRTTWILPAVPASFYGNYDYLRSFVDWDVSTDNSTFGDFASDTRTFDWADNTENSPNRTNLTAPSGQVRYYNVNVNMQYDNFGDGIGNYANVSAPALIDQFQVDNVDPGPATGDTIVQDPVTMTYGSPWVFNFVTPDFPDFEQYRTQLTKSSAAGTLNGDYMVPIAPATPQTWNVTESMWDNQAAWVANPFGTYNFYVDTYDNTVPTREMYDDPIAFSFPYTVYEALGEVLDLDGAANLVSIEYLYMDRVRAGWQAVDHKPFGLDPNLIHYVAELYYHDEMLSKWLLVDETDEVYQYDPVAGDPPIANPFMYADFNSGDYDFPAGDYRVRVWYYYGDPSVTSSSGDGQSAEFSIEYEGIPMAAPSITVDTEGALTGFTWTDPTNPTDPDDPYVMEYEVEVYGANGLEHHVTINDVLAETETTSLTFDPAGWWPSGNVYSAYRARVRLIDSLGRVGDWSPLSAIGNFPLPQIASYLYDVKHTDGSPAVASTPMTDRQLWVSFAKFADAPDGFINWDPNLVTFELEVDLPGSIGWYYVLLQNQWLSEGHVVPVGVEGLVKSYDFFFRPLYDGVPMMPFWSQQGPFIIDLEPPVKPTGLGVTVNPVTAGPTFNWDFNWADAPGAVGYDLIVHRLSNLDGAVDATYTADNLVSSDLDFNPVLIFGDRVYGNYSFEVVAYDGLGNSITSDLFDFAQPLPSLNVSTVAVTTSQITWATSVERVSYDVLLEGDNGLDYMWENITTSPLAINLETLFPGLNVYTKWTASVRAYDRDGNVGDWYSGTMTLSLPNFTALSFEVYKFDGSIVPVATKMNIRDMFIKWAEYNTIPTGFINWDKTKVTFQLHAVMSGGSTQSIDVSNINNGETNIQVPVGEEGKEIVYAFTVDMFYDGVLVVQNSPITKAHYTIDLMAPAIPTGLAHNIAVAPWTFSWTATGGDTTGYTFELQKIDPVTGLVINDYTLDLTATNTTVNPLELNWSVFGSYRWRVHAYDQFRNTSTSTWALFNYTLDGAIAPWSMDYELIGEENSLWESILEYSNKRTAIFGWSVPTSAVIGLDMEQVDYVFELQKSTGIGWVNVKEYSLTWNPTYMESEVTVGITGETTHYRGRVRAEYQTEQTGWIYSNVFAIDLERPEFIEGAEAPSYSSTDEEYPSWLFTWDEATDEEVGLGGFLFVLERLEGDTTHAIAMIDLPVEYETEPEPGDNGIGAYSFSFEEGKYLLEMDPFEYVETIDGTFRYTVIPYDRLENLGAPIAGQFTSVWSDGDDYGTYPFINLYDNWMGEIDDDVLGFRLGVNNNTYATISFDIFGLEGYTLEFRLNGTLLVEGTDYRLIERPNDLYYLVLLESVRDMIQADDMGELEIYAYVEEDDIVVQFTVDAFSYIYLNQRTGFGFGRFRPALND